MPLYERVQVELLGEDVGLRPGVGDVALRVQLLGGLHRVLGRDAQLAGPELLELLTTDCYVSLYNTCQLTYDSVHGQRPPLGLWLVVALLDLGRGSLQALVVVRHSHGLVEQADPSPVELDLAVLILKQRTIGIFEAIATSFSSTW